MLNTFFALVQNTNIEGSEDASCKTKWRLAGPRENYHDKINSTIERRWQNGEKEELERGRLGGVGGLAKLKIADNEIDLEEKKETLAGNSMELTRGLREKILTD